MPATQFNRIGLVSKVGPLALEFLEASALPAKAEVSAAVAKVLEDLPAVAVAQVNIFDDETTFQVTIRKIDNFVS